MSADSHNFERRQGKTAPGRLKSMQWDYGGPREVFIMSFIEVLVPELWEMVYATRKEIVSDTGLQRFTSLDLQI
jgi:hypothetical protein